MTTKNLIVLGGVAAVLVAAGYFAGGKRAAKVPQLNGSKLVAAFDVASVGSLEIGDRVKLVAGDAGWTVATYQDYPADRARITENLMKLLDLKVGQVIRGKTVEEAEKVPVKVRDATGQELASLTLGPRHERWGFGRYAEFKGQTVLVGDSLDAFGEDAKSWCETRIVDEPRICFKELAAPDLSEEVLGFTTGVVAKVTINCDTNCTVTVGNVVPGGSDRYLKVEGRKWTFILPDYAVKSLLPQPEAEEKSDASAETEKDDIIPSK